ncbi:NADP-dependent oxidoreductase [Gloeobacter kilaueensis]|uniref:Alcohol dehydrogenase zinc-binding domain protein n=1 Tax=Gloeobacter kilaueensis (strain ATCC BAA-2537 / CCAP 1431/1 / ULC 316 / JS1) TaxID=1183438 RepID=U5QDG8_GLOK1|nr:NADP-dependent oxidoreductase [Gloeobacter kilaueensis]AGY56883.1 alcohol dehydrogenase zinc-binding domain protein [Gloeobacter kilaueensis JS1]
MKAVRIYAYGGPEVLQYEDVPQPTAAEGQVLVQLEATAVNPIDWKIRAGLLREMMSFSFPLILGCDLAGTVVQVGPKTSGFAVGDAVYGMPRQENGTYARYAAVDATDIAPKPRSLDFVQAASLPAVALTAWQGLFSAGGLEAGQSVLIHAAAGGVGSLAVQLAKVRGARVIGTTSAGNVEFVRSLGADEVIDYKAVPFEQVVSGVDLVLDLLGGATQQRSWQLLRPGGTLVSTVFPRPVAPREDVQATSMAVVPDAGQLAQITELIDSGKIRPIVGTVLPLSEVQQAHRLSETGHVRGKIVLTLADPD